MCIGHKNNNSITLGPTCNLTSTPPQLIHLTLCCSVTEFSSSHITEFNFHGIFNRKTVFLVSPSLARFYVPLLYESSAPTVASSVRTQIITSSSWLLDQCSRSSSRVLYAEKGDNNWVNQPTNQPLPHFSSSSSSSSLVSCFAVPLCAAYTGMEDDSTLYNIFLHSEHKEENPKHRRSSLCIVNGWLGGNWVNPTTVQIIYPCLCYRVHISSGYGLTCHFVASACVGIAMDNKYSTHIRSVFSAVFLESFRNPKSYGLGCVWPYLLFGGGYGMGLKPNPTYLTMYTCLSKTKCYRASDNPHSMQCYAGEW